MTVETVRAVNIAVLGFCSLEAIILMVSYRRDSLKRRSSRIFFAKVVVTAFTMLCYTASFIHHTEPRDAFGTITLALAYIGIYAVFFLYIEYLKENINSVEKNSPVPAAVTYISIIVSVIGALLWVLSIFDSTFAALGEQVVSFGPAFALGHAGGFTLIAISLAMLARYYRTLGARQTLILSSMPLLMLAAIFLEPFSQGIELRYPAIMLEFLIIYTQHHLDLENKAGKNENDEIRARLNLATGRMKPHYLYNVLTTIYYLCESDPEKAQNAIGTFSEYLRATLETLEKQQLVGFDWELGEIRNYLTLEKLRFGDRLRVEFDTEYDEFQVPPLSIQPLVENAVKHGISPQEEGGTVRIISRKLSDGGAQIRVQDDGAGFDIDSLKSMDVTHEGLSNVRERLRLEVGGDMTITSEPGKGTTVVVTIRPGKGN